LSVTEYRKQSAEYQSALSSVMEWPSITHRHSATLLDEFPTISASTSAKPATVSSESDNQVKVIKHKNPTQVPIIGASSENQRVKSVATTHNVDVFISRLHPETVENELLECAKESAATGGVKIVDMSCSKLKSKYEYLYSSFYVSVRVESMQFKKAIDLYMSPEAWPVGVLVKRFFKPRNG